jgi:hypothetical protein
MPYIVLVFAVLFYKGIIVLQDVYRWVYIYDTNLLRHVERKEE